MLGKIFQSGFLSFFLIQSIVFAENVGKENGGEQLLLTTGNWIFPDSWSRDGRYVLFEESNPKTNFDLWVLPMSENAKPFPLLNAPYMENHGAFSPDGKYFAYSSEETGKSEIFIQPFPDVSQNDGGRYKQRISINHSSGFVLEFPVTCKLDGWILLRGFAGCATFCDYHTSGRSFQSFHYDHFQLATAFEKVA